MSRYIAITVSIVGLARETMWSTAIRSGPGTTKINNMLKVAIIGAGASGLCCARRFSKFPDEFSIQVYEQTSTIGGTWVYTDRTGEDEHGQPVHTSMYKDLRVNIPKQLLAFRDFPFPADVPSYPFQPDALRYLQRYSEHHNLSKFIRFNTLVEKVVPLPRTVECQRSNDAVCVHAKGSSAQYDFNDTVKWQITIQNILSGDYTVDEVDLILVCNGKYFKPYVSDVKGLQSFPGPVIHSHSYRDASLYKNQNVLVVGSGFSGVDIALQIVDHAKKVFVCYHHKPSPISIPGPIELLPPIENIGTDGTVCFANNEQRPVDSIILCTGYEYEFPFLTAESGITVHNHRIAPLYKHTFNAVHPSLAFIGMNFPTLAWPCADFQVQWVLSVWSRKKQLPSSKEMIKHSDDDYQKRLQSGLSPRQAHYIILTIPTQREFMDELAELGGVDPFEPVLWEIGDDVLEELYHNILAYKEIEYCIVTKDKWTKTKC